MTLYSNERLYTCECSWFRDLSTDPGFRRRRITHPVYGKVTNEAVARIDVARHDCTNTEISRRILQGVIRHAA